MLQVQVDLGHVNPIETRTGVEQYGYAGLVTVVEGVRCRHHALTRRDALSCSGRAFIGAPQRIAVSR